MAHKSLIIDFWDVGQGDCSVVHLPNDELLLIDLGPRCSPVIGWLQSNVLKRINAIILTHNDADHIGALNSIIESCHSRIHSVYFLEDRNKKDEIFVRLVRRLDLALQSKEIHSILRLEAPQTIWRDDELKCSLDVKFPSVIGNIKASSANETSSILVLSVNSQPAIVWPSDNKLRNIAAICSGFNPFYMVGPHHGAPADRADVMAQQWINDIHPQNIIMSVGSLNKYDHPQKSYINKATKSGAHVYCTELTTLCEHRNKLQDVLKSHAILGLPQPLCGFTCRGTIRLTLNHGVLTSDQFLNDKHAESVKLLTRPRCINK